uniref:O-acyltransferase n=1 Tax=Neogobius melanostomus TaxID=47308 RepID=A0A8C6TBN4_9GOBI
MVHYILRRSLPVFSELFEISHIRTIYHMFLALFLLFGSSTLIVDYLEHGRPVLKFDLLFYAFGNLGTVTLAWTLMFVYTLLVPYKILMFWSSLYHTTPSKLALNLGTGAVLWAIQFCVLGLFPVYVVIHNQLPPASRFIVILEQIRFQMKTYSFIRESVPMIVNSSPEKGEKPKIPTFSSYLYFLFCPTLIYRESYPRLVSILYFLFYGYYILERLCVQVFRPDTPQTFSKRSMVLAVFNAILPGTMLLLLCFFAFLHCWLNLFAELMRFADRMFYKDWWNSYSFANYYRTWNVVVHDFLYYYGYRDFLWLSKRKSRAAAMLCVFMVSAFVHEYALGMGFGFFYPVLFFSLPSLESPVCNVLMWTSLFLGQGVQVCLYSQEWYSQIHCPPKGVCAPFNYAKWHLRQSGF